MILTCTGFCLICYSSNGQTRQALDNGAEYECKDVAKATTRYCLKFKTDSRPDRVFRECDHIYEHLFGYDIFGNIGEG